MIGEDCDGDGAWYDIGSSQTVGGLPFCGFDSWELVVSVVHNTVGALDLLWKGVKLERRVGVVNH